MGAYAKNVLRTIWSNKRRSLILVLITALGAAFFIGIRSASPDMNITLSDYLDRQSMYDIQVISNYGLTEKNIEQLRAVDGVERVVSAYSTELFAKVGDDNFIFRFHSCSTPGLESDKSAEPEVVKGRMPVLSGECAVSIRFAEMNRCSIGDTLTLSTGDDTLVADFVSHNVYVITGFVESPRYLRVDLGPSNKGSGSTQGYAYIPSSDFTLEVYTEAQVFLSNPEGYSRFDERFKAMSSAVEEELQLVGDELTAHRRRTMSARAAKEISDTAARLETAREALARSESELSESELLFTESQMELIRQRRLLNEQIISGRRELDIGNIELIGARLAIEQGKLLLSDGRKTLEEIRSSQNRGTDISGASEEIERRLAYEETALQAKESELLLAEAELDTNRAKLLYNADALDTSLYDGLVALSVAEVELSAARAVLDDSQARFQAEKASADALTTIAESTLSDARRTLGALPEAKCYVLGLDLNTGFESFRQDSERVGNIGRVFPLVFFLIAALVAFTSMVRIVEDDRSTAAVMHSLGYDPGKVLGKYVTYALSVGLPGVILGIAVGYRLFPTIIFDYGYRIMYRVPPVKILLYPELCVWVCVISLISIMVPTVLISITSVRQNPAVLMRPKAPSPGKRILLEYIQAIWTRMNFSAKVTARNILRYKKRFIMTIAGISGCTAIVLTGFGLHDSIRTLAAKQYDEIYLYDFIVTVANSSSDKSYLEHYLAQQNDVSGWQFQRWENIDAKLGDKETSYETIIIVPDDAEMLADFIKLADPHTGKPTVPSDNGVIITQKLASLLKVSSGDEITIIDEDDAEWTVSVEGIAENYVRHFIYMTPVYYSIIKGVTPDYNTIVGRAPRLADERVDEISEKLLENKSVTALIFNSKMRNFYDDTLNALNIIVFVLIVCGALLAFVVLFCLTGINIDERKREIATLKVLGFYDGEAMSYIFRENIVNTVVGSILGLGLGVLLHRYIIQTVEIDMMMFGRIVEPPSYVYSIALTFFFTFIVNVAMSGSIRKIDMIESLKSAE